MKDPYLIPGQICEVWNDENYWVYYFYKYDNFGKPTFTRFKITKEYESLPGLYFDNYRPIGTEWDFDPPWALDPKNENVCSTVDSDGKLKIWDNYPKIILPYQYKKRFFDHGIFTWASGCHNMIVCGICPDKSRYEGDAWKTSLRMRQEWAMKKDNG